MLCFVSVCMYVSVGAWIRLCRLWFNKQDPLLPLRTAGSLTAPAQICCEAGWVHLRNRTYQSTACCRQADSPPRKEGLSPEPLRPLPRLPQTGWSERGTEGQRHAKQSFCSFPQYSWAETRRRAIWLKVNASSFPGEWVTRTLFALLLGFLLPGYYFATGGRYLSNEEKYNGSKRNFRRTLSWVLSSILPSHLGAQGKRKNASPCINGSVYF